VTGWIDDWLNGNGRDMSAQPITVQPNTNPTILNFPAPIRIPRPARFWRATPRQELKSREACYICGLVFFNHIGFSLLVRRSPEILGRRWEFGKEQHNLSC